jgi:predicted nucleotide-binding protein (sugar kinase/HSP70/actin superfamily)
MNWRIPAISLLAAASMSNASAQSELPNQWVNEQMLAAKLSRTTPRSTPVAAVDATVGDSRSVARKEADTRTAQAKEPTRPAVGEATRSLTTDK